ncbi:MAG: cyclic nucleotide-binding domain-containing protein [Deltaproteobacteria bacterium]|nr:cyclic nucleotide-binding domain-containing protein [Deltaproteobacteria bacterium]
MTREQVQAAVSAYLRGEFGKLLVVRELRRVHHVDAYGWKVRIVAPLKSGDVDIAELEVDERGVLSPLLDPDGVVEVLRASREEEPPASVRLDSLDLGGLDEQPPASLEMPGTTTVLGRIRSHLAKNELERARSLYPRVLADPEVRASALLGMADIERRLGNTQTALGYLEAAAREFADRFDLEGLEDAATAALDLVGQTSFAKTPIHSLLERSRARIQPIASVTMAPALAGATPSERAWLEKNAEIQTVRRGEFLVREGDPSRAVFVIRSGIIAVMLEKPDGGQRMVRCCFPGWLLGEASVLSDGARCSASLRAERITELFRIDAALLKTVMEKNPTLRDRIAQTKQIHRIDSFFAMHETMGQLDALVRDEMLACLDRIQSFDEDTLLFPSGEVPAQACLVARGELALHKGWELDTPPVATIGVDHFANVRDAVHMIESPFTTLAKAGSTIAFFDGKKLRALAEASPPNVSAVLERLG